MTKLNIRVEINDYIINEIGYKKNNEIALKDNNTTLIFNYNDKILTRENNEMKQVINFKKQEFTYLLKEIKQEFKQKINVLSIKEQDNKTEIVYRIEENTFYLKIICETI